MNDELAPRVRRRLDQTLAQWRHWHCSPVLRRAPRLLRSLGGGHSNHSLLVESGARFVVRIEGAGGGVHGINRQAEWRALQDAAAAGLAPQPRYFNPDLGSLVYDYLPPDAQQGGSPADTAALLRAIHALPARRQRLDLAQRIPRYEQVLAQRGEALPAPLAARRAALQASLEHVRRDAGEPVTCHHDLLRANRLYSGGRLYALDWEYSAMGSGWYDLAVVLHGDDMPPEAGEQLVTAYLEREPRPEERALLRHYGALYRYLELLWYLALPSPAPGVNLRGRQARLLALLDGASPGSW